LFRVRSEAVAILFLGLVAGVGTALIDWPPFTEVNPNDLWGYTGVLLFPLAYVLLSWTVDRTDRLEVVGLALGLAYGGVLWTQTIIDLAFLNGLDLAEVLDYTTTHAYDLLTIAAFVGAVGYFSAGPSRRARMISLAGVLALVGLISGGSSAQFLWAHHRPLDYPYWVLAVLWALTGLWYGLCVGFRPPSIKLARTLHGVETELGLPEPGPSK